LKVEAEVRGQRSEVRGRRSEVIGQQAETRAKKILDTEAEG